MFEVIDFQTGGWIITCKRLIKEVKVFSNQIELRKYYIYAIIIIYLNTYGLNVLQLFIQGTWILTALTRSESVQVKLRQIEL